MNHIRLQFDRKRATRAFLLLVLLMVSLTSCEELLNLPGGIGRGRLVDLWLVNENLTSRKSAMEVYYVEIREHPSDSARILIANFLNVDSGTDAEAILSGRQLTLPTQTLEGGYTVSGTGDVSDDWERIDWSYNVNDGSGIHDSYTAVYRRAE